MAQMTWRAPDELLERVRRQAVAQGRSLNEWVTTILDAASDPATAGGEAQRVRERLVRAGLLESSAPAIVRRPTPAALERARAAAGRGANLSELVSDGRG